MAKKPNTEELEGTARLEFRVWGEHRHARSLLRDLASEETEDCFDDCYLLVDDPRWNVKVRDNALKLKQLVAENKGFERWVAHKHHSAETVPELFDRMFDAVFERLESARSANGENADLIDAFGDLNPSHGLRAVFVTKHRRRYRIGELRAEVTDIRVVESGEVLRTLAIEGDDLTELISLRRRLDLKGEPNTPVHQAIEDGLD